MTITLALYLALALLLGGVAAQGGWPDALLAVLALPLLACGAWHLQAAGRPLATPLLALVLATLALPLLQLLPWASWPVVGPSLQALHATFGVLPLAEADVPAHRAWSLHPQGTWWSLLALLPPLAVLVAAASLDRRGRGRLLGVALAVATVQAVIAILQTPEGGAVLPTFHGPEGEQARGTFANRNHLGLLMVLGAGIGLSLLWRRTSHALAEGWRVRDGLVVGASLAAVLLCLVALLLSQSRAAAGIGLLLGGLALLGLWWQPRRQAGGKRLLAVIAGLVLVAVNLGAYGVMQRFAADPLDADRSEMAAQTAALAREALPWGTGLGSFPAVYAQREPAALGLDAPLTNHAHNDWLEWLLETGIAGLALMLAWFGLLAWCLWRARPWSPGVGVAALLVAAPLLHSLVDYPLRTLAISTLFALVASDLLLAKRKEDRPPVSDSL